MKKREVFDNKYKELNLKQKKAVDTIEGPVMVVAGPGTGKTTILTLRIANILLKTDIAPENILALTFTNSGVHAIRKNLIKQIGDEAYRINIFTFHSFAESIIKEFPFYFKVPAQGRNDGGGKVITDLENVHILEEIISKGKFKDIVSDYDIFSSLKQISDAISSLKQEGISPEEFKKMIPKWEEDLLSDDNIFYKRKFGKHNAGDIKPSEKEKVIKKISRALEIQTVFKKYQEVLKEKGLYDFSDMILNVLSELSTNTNLKLDLQEQYQYLLIDEHQDTNNGQNKLIEYLTDAEHLNGRPNVFTVGDEKQSIYRFQGASKETFDHFKTFYNDVEIITLDDNYRSTENILEGSHSVISHTLESEKLKANKSNKSNKLNKVNKVNKNIKLPIKIAEFSNYKFELLYLVEEIKNLIKTEKIDPKEIAIIYRSNKHVEDIKEVLSQNGVPHTILSKENILADIQINNLITLLRVIHNPNDNYSLGKALFIDFLKLDSYEVVNILNQFNRLSRNKESKNKKLFSLLINSDKQFSEFTEKIKELKTLSENSNFSIFFKDFLDKSGYLEYMLKSKNSRDQLLKIDKLFDEIKRQSQNVKNYTLADFIKLIDAYTKYHLDIETQDPEIIDGVKLMTAHKSKGLEFEYVFMINTTRKNWEKSRGFSSIALPIENYKGTVDDERRLFYVSMTRAKTGLFITSSLTDWEGKEQDKSQFISEIEEDFVENIDTNKFEKENIDNLSAFIKHTQIEKTIWNKEYLSKLFIEKNISVTSLNNYLSCPIKYLFRNLIQLPSAYTPSLLYGNLIHNSLEEFFNKSSEIKKLASKKDLLNLYRESIKDSSMYGDEYLKYLERGESALSEYYDFYHKDWIININNEKYIKREFILDSKEVVNISGKLDKIEYLDTKNTYTEIQTKTDKKTETKNGDINIVDYKTGKPYSDKSTKEQKEDLKRQLVFYHILLEDYDKGKFIIKKATLDFIEKNKKGEFEQYAVDVKREDITEVKDLINKMSKEILAGEFLNKGCNKRDCEYCKMLL